MAWPQADHRVNLTLSCAPKSATVSTCLTGMDGVFFVGMADCRGANLPSLSPKRPPGRAENTHRANKPPMPDFSQTAPLERRGRAGVSRPHGSHAWSSGSGRHVLPARVSPQSLRAQLPGAPAAAPHLPPVAASAVRE